jgi:hypothetical protein
MTRFPDCRCGRQAEEHRWDLELKAFMEAFNGECEGYEPAEDIQEEVNFG